MSSNFSSLSIPITPPYPVDDWWEEAEYADDTAVEQYPDDFWPEEPAYWAEPPYYVPSPQPPHILLLFVGAGVILMGILVSLLNFSGIGSIERIPAQTAVPPTLPNVGRNSLYVADPFTVVAPYANYTLTQGLHGQSYGHLAIDLAAGRGEPVRSPISGFVTNYYIDQYNNTTLVIENEVYVVTMLHGDFAVGIGDELKAGQTVGTEGNNGYTMDYFGNLCYGRDWCGNHTHLNIYDKRIRSNISPLEFMQ